MKDDRLLEPIKYYNDYLREELENKLDEKFEELVEKSGVDRKRNIEEIKDYCYNHNRATSSDNTKKTQKILLIFLSVIYVLFFLFWNHSETSSNFFQSVDFLIIVTALYFAILIFLLIKISNNNEKSEQHNNNANEALRRAKEGMECLFDLFDEEKYIEIFESVLPRLKIYEIIPKSFEKYLYKISSHPCDDFDYYYNSKINEDSGTLFALYGTIEGKPFLFFKNIIFEMGEKTYTGSSTLPYTESYRDSDGEWHTETYYETIHASVSMPYPMYNSHFKTFFFTDTAPNLVFDRIPFKHNNDIDGYVYSMVKKLNKKEKKEGKTYLVDKEFEVLFNAIDRNNDVEFRMMFTPYVIKNMKELIRSTDGPGNDFEYYKRGKMSSVIYKDTVVYDNHIIPSFNDVFNYALEDTKKAFVEKGISFFNAIFFTLAPILTIKLNTDGETIREEKEDVDDQSFVMSNYSHTYDAESLVYDNVDYVRPLNSVTDVIVRAEFINNTADMSLFKINSSSFSLESKWTSQYVFGFHVRGYVDVMYDEYFEEKATNYLISSYLGLPTYFIKKCIIGFVDDKLVYKNGFLGLIVNNIDRDVIERYKIIVKSIKTKAEGVENGK